MLYLAYDANWLAPEAADIETETVDLDAIMFESPDIEAALKKLAACLEDLNKFLSKTCSENSETSPELGLTNKNK